MGIDTLTTFFMWCTIINGGLYISCVALVMFSPDFGYRIHKKLFSISRETFDMVVYACLGFLKIIFLAFNLVPYVALLIIG